ncbi:MAG: GldG family protein [Candidatus Adiutrix sp.]|jgi:hypothetical protein|nr:GldG family protein [Candidatus Adiutrix sp.]
MSFKAVIAAAGLILALFGHLAAPQFPGFTVLPLAAALFFAVLAGKRERQALWARSRSLAGRAKLKLAALSLICLGLALAAGALSFLPAYDLSPGRKLGLAPETVALLKRLDRKVAVSVHLGPQHPRAALAREMMNKYRQAAPGFLEFSFINPQTETAAVNKTARLVAPDTAAVEAEGFRENISPVTEESLNAALTRLLLPADRLVYFISTFGEKMVQDQGPGGLSRWAEDLASRRVAALDYYWADGTPLPAEAAALVLVGPRAPLGEWREERLLNYLKGGGKVLLMVDPLTVAVSADFWRPFGLKQADGLVVDPEKNMAGTGDGFVVSQDYPTHPLTASLGGRPVVWPLAGAFETTEEGRTELPVVIYAAAVSSSSSWLETDAASFAAGEARYQKDIDRPGPLVLAVAGEMGAAAGDDRRGRFLALADSDLAANSFHGFNGNREFCLAALTWLLDGREAPPLTRDEGQSLLLGRAGGRLVFWLPVFVWPLLALSVWFFIYRRTRG